MKPLTIQEARDGVRGRCSVQRRSDRYSDSLASIAMSAGSTSRSISVAVMSLEQKQLGIGGLQTWEQHLRSDKPRFDVVLQDMSDLKTRLAMLPDVLGACRPGGLVVIDDMHVPAYGRAVLAELARTGTKHFSLRSFTKKWLRYAYLVIV